MRTRILLLFLTTLVNSLCLTASAGVLRVDYSGHVDSITPVGADPNTVLDGSIHAGSLFTGSLTFDPDAMGVPGGGPGTGLPPRAYYGFGEPPWTFTTNVGDYALHANPSFQFFITLGDPTAPYAGFLE